MAVEAFSRYPTQVACPPCLVALSSCRLDMVELQSSAPALQTGPGVPVPGHPLVGCSHARWTGRLAPGSLVVHDCGLYSRCDDASRRVRRIYTPFAARQVADGLARWTDLTREPSLRSWKLLAAGLVVMTSELIIR